MDNKFDSKEEMYISWWINDLMKEGMITKVVYQPEPFHLSPSFTVDYYVPYKKKEGGKYVSEPIISKHIYTPDIYVEWSNDAINIFVHDLLGDLKKKKNRLFILPFCQYDHDKETWYSFFEVKPNHDRHNMTRLAKINIQWVFYKYSKYVNIITPEKLFKKTFTPERYLYTDKSGKPRKIKFKTILIKDYIKSKEKWKTF